MISRFEDGVRVTCYSGLVPFAVYGLLMRGRHMFACRHSLSPLGILRCDTGFDMGDVFMFVWSPRYNS